MADKFFYDFVGTIKINQERKSRENLGNKNVVKTELKSWTVVWCVEAAGGPFNDRLAHFMFSFDGIRRLPMKTLKNFMLI